MHFQGELLHARLLKSICHLLTSREAAGLGSAGQGQQGRDEPGQQRGDTGSACPTPPSPRASPAIPSKDS